MNPQSVNNNSVTPQNQDQQISENSKPNYRFQKYFTKEAKREAKRKQDRELKREKRKMMKELPKENKERQEYYKNISETQKRWKNKVLQKDLKYFANQKRILRQKSKLKKVEKIDSNQSSQEQSENKILPITLSLFPEEKNT